MPVFFGDLTGLSFPSCTVACWAGVTPESIAISLVASLSGTTCPPAAVEKGAWDLFSAWPCCTSGAIEDKPLPPSVNDP